MYEISNEHEHGTLPGYAYRTKLILRNVFASWARHPQTPKKHFAPYWTIPSVIWCQNHKIKRFLLRSPGKKVKLKHFTLLTDVCYPSIILPLPFRHAGKTYAQKSSEKQEEMFSCYATIRLFVYLLIYLTWAWAHVRYMYSVWMFAWISEN
jgi:hypothetical protein